MKPIRLPQKTWDFLFNLAAAGIFGVIMAVVTYYSGMDKFIGGIITGGATVHHYFRLARNTDA